MCRGCDFRLGNIFCNFFVCAPEEYQSRILVARVETRKKNLEGAQRLIVKLLCVEYGSWKWWGVPTSQIRFTNLKLLFDNIRHEEKKNFIFACHKKNLSLVMEHVKKLALSHYAIFILLVFLERRFDVLCLLLLIVSTYDISNDLRSPRPRTLKPISTLPQNILKPKH